MCGDVVGEGIGNGIAGQCAGGGRGTREPNSYSEPFQIEFNNAFPVRLGELSLASDATDSKMEFTVDFAYETYTFVDGSLGQTVNGLV